MIEVTGQAGQRLDQLLAGELPQYSRARIQEWIKQGLVRVDAETRKASYVLRGGEAIVVHPAARPPLRASPEPIGLEVLYEDEALVAVNKPAGMTVHAGAGVHQGTLVNALLHRYQRLSSVNGDDRPGIVHRLDRFTSGVMLVARTDEAHRHLAAQFAGRTTEKVYLALVHGVMRGESGRVEKPIARNATQRFKMTTSERGRYAISEWRVLTRFENFTLVEVKIGTGRTHQIRVHLASLRHPVAGDTTYGAPANPLAGERFFLHAARITFQHPVTNQAMTIEAPLPAELRAWLAALA